MYKNLRWVVEVIPRDEEGYELPIVIPQDVPVVTAADQARIEQEMANLAFLPLPPIDAMRPWRKRMTIAVLVLCHRHGILLWLTTIGTATTTATGN